MSDEAMSPWFHQVERRLSIGPWLVPPNPNNQLLQLGAARLGIPSAAIPRNVKACWNLGFVRARLSDQRQAVHAGHDAARALDRGATLLVQTRVLQLDIQNSQVRGLKCAAVAVNGELVAGAETHVSARHVVVAGGAINSPGLLLRSGRPTRTRDWVFERSFIRWWLRPLSSRNRSRRGTAPRSRCTATTSSTSIRWTGPWATSWKRRRCTR
jgi:choline dehydrogenase-like flavoprotein